MAGYWNDWRKKQRVTKKYKQADYRLMKAIFDAIDEENNKEKDDLYKKGPYIL